MAIIRDVIRHVIKPVLVDVSDQWWSRPPIVLKVEYTDTQLKFNFRLPVTSTITVYDGDGTETVIVGTGNTEVVHYTSYTVSGTYYFYVVGDYADIYTMGISSSAFVSGSIDRWGALLGLKTLYCVDSEDTNKITGPNLYGDISNLADLPLRNIGFVSGANLTGDLSTLRNAPLDVALTLLDCGNFTFESTDPWTLSDNSIAISTNLPTQSVDNMIAAFKDKEDTFFNFSGNASRSAASDADLLEMINNGCEILIREDAGISLPVDVEIHTDANAASDPNGNEADATTGWDQVALDAGSNVFESQSLVKADGDYALKADGNDTPSTSLEFSIDFTTVSAIIYRSAFKWRHFGTGGGWSCAIGGVSPPVIIQADVVEFEPLSIYRKATDVTTTQFFVEKNILHDGGLYIDALSFRKVPNVPIVLKVVYTDTQFDFAFRAPSGSTLNIYDGDGTMTPVSGNDLVNVVHTTSYAAPGTYYFYVEGDYSDIILIDIGSIAFVSGDITGWGNVMPGLETLLVDNTGMTGSIDSLAGLSVTPVYLFSSCTGIIGDIALFAGRTITTMHIFGTSVSGDFSKACTAYTGSCFIVGAPVTFDTIVSWEAGGNSYAQDCNWTSEMVDNCLISLANGETTGRKINIGGNNAVRTSASDAAMIILEDSAHGNTITVNE